MGEAAIRSGLTQLQQLIGAPMDGPKKKFGDLYDRLAHDLTGEDYRPFRNLLRDHIATTWPLGPGDELMGEPVLERRVHSVLTAARDTGIDARRMRKLLAEAGWVRPAGEGREDAWELFDAVAAAPFLRSLGEGISALELQERLGISRSQFDLLRKDGCLRWAGSACEPRMATVRPRQTICRDRTPRCGSAGRALRIEGRGRGNGEMGMRSAALRNRRSLRNKGRVSGAAKGQVREHGCLIITPETPAGGLGSDQEAGRRHGRWRACDSLIE